MQCLEGEAQGDSSGHGSDGSTRLGSLTGAKSPWKTPGSLLSEKCKRSASQRIVGLQHLRRHGTGHHHRGPWHAAVIPWRAAGIEGALVVKWMSRSKSLRRRRSRAGRPTPRRPPRAGHGAQANLVWRRLGLRRGRCFLDSGGRANKSFALAARRTSRSHESLRHISGTNETHGLQLPRTWHFPR